MKFIVCKLLALKDIVIFNVLTMALSSIYFLSIILLGGIGFYILSAIIKYLYKEYHNIFKYRPQNIQQNIQQNINQNIQQNINQNNNRIHRNNPPEYIESIYDIQVIELNRFEEVEDPPSYRE